MITIELTLLIALTFSIFAMLGMLMDKVNWFTALLSIVGAFGISYYLAPFTELIYAPLKNAIWYGYSWGFYEYMALALMVSYFAIGVQAMYNLYMSNGKKVWG